MSIWTGEWTSEKANWWFEHGHGEYLGPGRFVRKEQPLNIEVDSEEYDELMHKDPYYMTDAEYKYYKEHKYDHSI